MSTPASRPLWHGRALALVGVILVAFSLRSAVASLSPLIGHIARDFPVSSVVLGLIGTAPPLCYAVFGIVTPALERRFGLERLATLSMVVIAIGLLTRSLAPDALVLLLATALVFAAVGTGNILLPPLVKKYFPDRLGLMMTLYSTTMAVATFLPPLFAVPIADAAGWRFSLSLWAVFAVAAIVPWVVMAVRERAAAPVEVEETDAGALGRMWRIPLAWMLMIGFAVSGVLAYTSFAWLPVILTDVAGVSAAEAGGMLSLFAILSLPGSMLVPLIVVRFGAVRAVFAVAITCGFIGLGGLLFAPTVAPWLWVGVFGLSGSLFPLSLVLLGIRARTHEGAVALSGFVQSVGYAVVAVFPVGIGVVHDLTGSWTIPLVVLLVVVAAAIAPAIVVAHPRTVEDEWERRRGAW
ncbi:CynX/NimT family MFS transporter [Microbacterium sp.]|uniref:MFS transporter n=1 Tax=Microbacterium sp. TaxID=51671 RepID=UPI0039E50DB2